MSAQTQTRKRQTADSTQPAPVGLHLNREEAAAYFASKGFRHITVLSLARMATRPDGGGPSYTRFGRLTYYAQADLDAWLAQKVAAGLQKGH